MRHGFPDHEAIGCGASYDAQQVRQGFPRPKEASGLLDENNTKATVACKWHFFGIFS
jgi:hypothetical protein